MRPSLAPATRAVGVYARHRYRILFFGLLVTLAAQPLSAALGLSGWVGWLFIATNLVVAAAGITDRRAGRAALVVAASAAVAVRALPEEALPAWLISSAGLIGLLIAVIAMAAAVRFALRGPRVDAEHVAAALSAYVLAGLLFAVGYVFVEYQWPGSIVELTGNGGALTLDTAVYYSFVTLATLGYGDVVPRGVARGIAVVEAVGAQLYLTVTVARLVGLHAMAAAVPPPDKGEDA